MYMLEKDNMTRHIEFLSHWVKTTIYLFTFTVTKKDTNNISKRQLTVFYMRMKNKISTTKNFKEEIIEGIPIQLFERRKITFADDLKPHLLSHTSPTVYL